MQSFVLSLVNFLFFCCAKIIVESLFLCEVSLGIRGTDGILAIHIDI
jgi:hypothetical protein